MREAGQKFVGRGKTLLLPFILIVAVATWLAWISWKLTWLVALYGQTWAFGASVWGVFPVLMSVLWLMIYRGRPVGKIGPILIAAHFLCLALAALLSEGSIRFAVLVLALFGLLFYLPLGLTLAVYSQNIKSSKRISTMLCAAIVVPPIFLLVWSPANALIIAARASATAGGAPYCVQLPGAREVRRWRELSGFNLQAPWVIGGSDEFQADFHAVLVVSRNGAEQMYNWSYRQQAFLPVSSRSRGALGLTRNCTPNVVFFREMQL